MYGIDSFIIAGCLSFFFLIALSVLAQRYFAVYNLFIGKKYASLGHIVLISFAWLEFLALLVLDIISKWLFTMAYWPLGALLFAASAMLFIGVVMESGWGVLVALPLFRKKTYHLGSLAKSFKFPLPIALWGLLTGLALLSGHKAYLIAAPLLAIGFLVLEYFTFRKQA